jgi:hypothetical protein
MISLAGYKVLHLLGGFLLFTALGGMLLASRAGVQTGVSRKLAGMSHGIALVVILVSGFGALARLGISNPGIWPLWMWLKLLLWLAFGAVIVLIRRAPRLTPALWWILPVLGAATAYLALYKPAF